MVLNATFNNISVISWRSVLLVEETGVPRENHRPVANNWQTWSHNVVSSTPPLSGIRIQNFIGDRLWLHIIGNCKSNYHTIRSPLLSWVYKWRIYKKQYIVCMWHTTDPVSYELSSYFNICRSEWGFHKQMCSKKKPWKFASLKNTIAVIPLLPSFDKLIEIKNTTPVW